VVERAGQGYVKARGLLVFREVAIGKYYQM